MLLLMGISNKTGRMLLTTGNKRDGRRLATLYGDMAGASRPSRTAASSWSTAWRTTQFLGRVIPGRVIDRARAELRPEQKGLDSLPPYEVL
jgi:NAD+ synthase (glutamine-hydrolysing)